MWKVDCLKFTESVIMQTDRGRELCADISKRQESYTKVLLSSAEVTFSNMTCSLIVKQLVSPGLGNSTHKRFFYLALNISPFSKTVVAKDDGYAVILCLQ